ncbi:MAG: diaminopimelate decarboxylase [Chloroflexi bacterium]|nr:MAG: diaminopimelate decarboxylase [Chloroflexota bacterium]MCQ3937615.1 diaminopimelate decarboxylase [Chloroflexota bacterium]MDL1944266.1 diaminopimelate decarboxylase [Chloroflexi bacterium CFX2]
MRRLDLFPITAKIENDQLNIAGYNLPALADRYQTPLYVYDRATLDSAAAGYKSALASFYPGAGSVTYAGKAFLCLALAQWTQLHRLTVDCTGEGEIAIAVAGGVSREKILVHGVNKSDDDLKAAIQHAGVIVVDNLGELRRLHVILSEAIRAPQRGENLSASMETLRSDNSPIPQSPISNPQLLITNYQLPSLWLRLLPGVAVSTHHAHTQTGQHDSKFGMTREEILEAAAFCKEHGLPMNGIHFHQGSNFRDPEPLIPAIELALDLAKEIGFKNEWHFCPGGGWGAAYHEDELPHPSIESYVRGIAEAVVEGCKSRGLTLPHLHLEPGRSLVARAGVAVYRVGAVKRRGGKTWVLIDGGMADNPRYALYGAKYSCLPVTGVHEERSEVVSIAGPYCESGDVLIEDLPMPKIKEGDLIAIPMSGAYHLSMSSNYNGARKPAVVWLEEGSARLIQRRETTEDLLRRDEGI